MEPAAHIDRKIWGIAWPAILSNLSIPLLGLVDSAILGHLGNSRYLAAVAVGAALLSFLYWGFSFLRMGTTGLVARAEGAGDRDGSVLVLLRSAVLALLLATLVLALHPLLIGAGLALMSPAVELHGLAESYARIRIYSAPAVLLTYTVVGWFIGRQDTRSPMLIVILTNLANIALDFLLVVGLDMRSDGAALATVIAEYLGCAVALACVHYQLRGFHPRRLVGRLRDISAYTHLLRSNRHLFVRTVCLLFGFAFFTAQGENLGSEIVAANTLMMHLLLMAAYGLDGFAYAAEGMSGHQLGGRDLAGFYAVVRRCALWSAGCAACLSAGLLVLQPLFVTVLTDLDALRTLMRTYYPWLIAMPLLAAPAYLLDGVFIGASETRQMMLTMLFSLCCVYLPLWYLTLPMGNHGLWLSFTAFNIARGITLYRRYRRMSRLGLWLPAA
ncbi:MATE family efflux transporter [Haliea sp. E17]|uniref:MATE family efflux transporter n=1 Tax=Haliea sp. E17 TaxID=3401576 RepID=UPI003AAC11B0